MATKSKKRTEFTVHERNWLIVILLLFSIGVLLVYTYLTSGYFGSNGVFQKVTKPATQTK